MEEFGKITGTWFKLYFIASHCSISDGIAVPFVLILNLSPRQFFPRSVKVDSSHIRSVGLEGWATASVAEAKKRAVPNSKAVRIELSLNKGRFGGGIFHLLPLNFNRMVLQLIPLASDNGSDALAKGSARTRLM